MGPIDELTVHEAASGGGARLRLFAAMPVPADIAERLADHGDALVAALDAGRTSDPATMHVTWAFLGSVAEDYVPAVARVLDAAAAEVPGPTMCSFGPVASFGRGRALAVEVDVELLAPLDAARDHFLATVAPYAPQLDRRAWRPHVTFLRSRKQPLPSGRVALPPPAASWVVPELRLYASLPGPDEHQHRIVHAVPFGIGVRNG